jgi:cytochrome c2
MDSRTTIFGWLLVVSCTTGAQAADLDAMNGLQIYNKECAVCHGNLAQKTGDRGPDRRQLVQVAMSSEGAKADFPNPLSSEWGDLPRHDLAGERLAVVPLYGPPLAGIVGKTAGTFSGYAYSEAFLKKMNGVTWDDAKLDAWIKSSQTLVPGSFMFYSQKKADARSKIIEYLKNQ